MDRLPLLLCALMIAATPAWSGNGTDGSGRSPELRLPADKHDKARPARQRERDNASTGASAPERRGGTDLGFEAEKEEEAFLKKKRTAPLKGR